MMTKFMNKQRGLLAAIMALVMVFAGVALVASDIDAESLPSADNKVVTLTADITLDEGTYEDVTIKGTHKITLSDSDGQYTFKNVVFDNNNVSDGVVLYLYSYESVTFENCTFTTMGTNVEDRKAISDYGTSGEVSFTGCHMNGNEFLFVGDKDGASNWSINGTDGIKMQFNNNGNRYTPTFPAGTGNDIEAIELRNSVTVQTTTTIETDVLIVEGTSKINSTNDNATVKATVINAKGSDATLESNVKVESSSSNIVVKVGNVTMNGGCVEVDKLDKVSNAFAAGAKEVIVVSKDNEGNVVIGTDKGTGEVTIPEGTELTIKSMNVSGYDSIKVDGTLFIEASDVRVPVTAGDKGEIIVTKAKKMTVTGDSTADLGVGYGNTLVLADLTVPAGKKIQAWGTVVIEGNVTVQKDAEFDVYQGGNAKIDGTLNIEGDALINGVADINGTVKVYYTDGDADFIVGQTGEVNVLGTMDVLKGKTKDTTNTLTIETVGDEKGELNVEGTLTVTGTLSGNVNDMGTVVFNGKAATTGAKITVFDGVTLTIASVDGTLEVTDVGIINKTELTGLNYAISASETITLKDVKGITISVAVKETVKEVEKTTGTGNDAETETVKYRFYVATMTVSGSVVDTDKVKDDSKVAIVNNSIWDSETTLGTDVSVEFPRISKSNVIVEDITIGEGVALEFNAVKVSVDGTVSVVAKNSSIETKKDVTVNGTIIVGDAEGIDSEPDVLKVNGAHYEVQSADMTETTCYYTTFQNALAAIGIYENSIDVLGTVDIETAVDVPAGIEVIMASESTMNIKTDGKVTVAADALLNADASKNIIVDGMLVIMDKEYGLDGEEKVKYQVKTETEESITYCGLILAIENAQAGDVIEIVGTDAVIDESITIPEGVTLLVPAKSALTIGDEEGDKVTLTVDGTLKVTGGVVDVEGNEDVTKIVINGVVAINGDMDAVEENYIELILISNDYVVFEMKVDGKYVTVMSNLSYAATNAVDGNLYVIGNITGGDVTFTQAENGQLSINVPVDSTLTVGTMTIIGDGAIITANWTDDEGKKNGTITGTITTAAGSVNLDKISDIKIEVDVEETVDAKTDVMIVDDLTTGLKGSLEVTSGTITAADGFKIKATKDNKMSVASGATLLIKKAFVATGTVDASNADVIYDVIVDGTISIVKGGQATIEYTTVNGAIDVASEGQLTVGTNSIITGTITVAEKTDDADEGKAYVKDNLFVGTAPSIGATGTLVGPFTTADNDDDTSNVIIAYPGSDLTGALIDVGTDGKSAAKSTEFYINGQLYMTAITAEGIAINTFANGLGIEIPGLDTPKNGAGTADEIKWFTDEALKTPVTNSTKIGDSEKLYAEFAASEVDLVVSAGVGLKVYIDGLAVENFKVGDEYLITVGTHIVSFAVESGYDGANATITVNGVAVSNNGTFTVDVDAEKITIIASGAVPAQSGSTVVVDDADDGMALTDILLIVLVVLIVIMAIIVALRMMRS